MIEIGHSLIQSFRNFCYFKAYYYFQQLLLHHKIRPSRTSWHTSSPVQSLNSPVASIVSECRHVRGQSLWAWLSHKMWSTGPQPLLFNFPRSLSFRSLIWVKSSRLWDCTLFLLLQLHLQLLFVQKKRYNDKKQREQKNKHVELAAKYTGAENRKDEEEKNRGLRMSQRRELRRHVCSVSSCLFCFDF